MFLLFCLVFTILVLLFWYIEDYKYWRIRNVKHDMPLPFLGNHFKNLFGMRSETEKCGELYNKYKHEKIVGYYRGRIPELIVRDPDLIRNILSTDFLNFYGRGVANDQQSIFLNVFHTHGDQWKILRHSLSPAFTSSKMRNMFSLLKNCTNRLQDVCYKLSEANAEISAYELMSRYTTEFIGVCGFGINFNTLNTEQSIFLELGKTIFTKSKRQLFLLALKEIFPKNHYIRRISTMKSKTDILIRDILEQVRKERNRNPFKRNDFVDILLELEKLQTIKGESLTERDVNGTPRIVELNFTETYTAAQLFVFFAAGFETSASTTSWTLHQLAHHPHIQRKVQDEIDRTLKKYNGVCYDAILELTYLEMTIKESIRTFSTGGYISRECMKKYLIPGTDVSIDPGVSINIPIQALHLDPQYYENPLEFRPERFSPEQERIRHKFVFLPFGAGPRKCIGYRLGLLETMSGLVAILQKFDVTPAVKRENGNLKVKPNRFFVQTVNDDIPILLKPRSNMC